MDTEVLIRKVTWFWELLVMLLEEHGEEYNKTSHRLMTVEAQYECICGYSLYFYIYLYIFVIKFRGKTVMAQL